MTHFSISIKRQKMPKRLNYHGAPQWLVQVYQGLFKYHLNLNRQTNTFHVRQLHQPQFQLNQWANSCCAPGMELPFQVNLWTTYSHAWNWSWIPATEFINCHGKWNGNSSRNTASGEDVSQQKTRNQKNKTATASFTPNVCPSVSPSHNSITALDWKMN